MRGWLAADQGVVVPPSTGKGTPTWLLAERIDTGWVGVRRLAAVVALGDGVSRFVRGLVGLIDRAFLAGFTCLLCYPARPVLVTAFDAWVMWEVISHRFQHRIGHRRSETAGPSGLPIRAWGGCR